jgi:hypothetical protein
VDLLPPYPVLVRIDFVLAVAVLVIAPLALRLAS